MVQHCPHCGSDAQLLFNLLKCSTEKCRNYDSVWAQDWLLNHGPRYTNPVFFGSSDHHFLGRYKGATGTNFDLYSCKTGSWAGGANTDLCMSRYGNAQEEAYYIDANETEIGIVGKGATQTVPKDVQTALKMALSIYRKRLKIIKKP